MFLYLMYRWCSIGGAPSVVTYYVTYHVFIWLTSTVQMSMCGREGSCSITEWHVSSDVLRLAGLRLYRCSRGGERRGRNITPGGGAGLVHLWQVTSVTHRHSQYSVCVWQLHKDSLQVRSLHHISLWGGSLHHRQHHQHFCLNWFQAQILCLLRFLFRFRRRGCNTNKQKHWSVLWDFIKQYQNKMLLLKPALNNMFDTTIEWKYDI